MKRSQSTGFIPVVFRLLHYPGRLFASVDVASLACFRILFGTLLAWKIWYFIVQGGVHSEYLASPIHFTYLGFGWVRPLPTIAMHLCVIAIGLLAVCLILGLFYRVVAPLFCVGYVYLFLVEQAYYLNHEYLICLISFIMVFVPAHRDWSLDRFLRRTTSSSTTPAWTLWLLRVQIAIPYIYGGIAKLDRDWLQGASVHLGLRERLDLPFIGGWLEHDAVAWGVVYGGLLFDLLIVPCLLWRKTRVAAFVIATLFHITNAILFNIGIFPWMMIAGTALFFPPDWPRTLMRWLGTTFRRSSPVESLSNDSDGMQSPLPVADDTSGIHQDTPDVLSSQIQTVVILLLFVSVQLAVPFRHHLYPGNPSWTGEGDQFAWRMMLNHKRGGVAFYALNPETAQRLPIDVRPMLSRFQHSRLAHDPDLILQLGHRLAEKFRDDGFEGFEIHVVSLVSLNGRRPQLLIDPETDLTQQHRSLFHPPFVLPLTEPLPEEPWDMPVRDWPSYFPDLFPAAAGDPNPKSGSTR
jgi:vitamin K-dependent gamma-carboxylase